jgi:hypothetical protein
MNIIGIKQFGMFYAFIIIFVFPCGPAAQLTVIIINKNFGKASFSAI